MSTDSNTKLLERAAELLDNIQSHPSGCDKLLEQAIDSGDLERVRYWVTFIEGELARTHFKNYDLVVW